MSRFEAVARRASLLLGTGYVLYFFSEALFWSQWRPDDALLGRVLAWFFYGFLAFLLLVVVWHFRIRDAWGLLLAGAAFGWIGEGVFAMTLFGDPSMPFPFTISWTALAWHAPISVVAGWHALGCALRAQRLRGALGLSLALGAFWGAWAYGWRFDSPPAVASEAGFLLHAALTTALLAVAYCAVSFGRPASFRPTRAGLVVAAVLLAGFVGVVTVPTVPLAALVLPVLTALLFLLLQRHRRASPGGSSILARHAPQPRLRNLATLAVMPATAAVMHAALGASGLPLHLLPVIGVGATFVGVVIFAIAAVKALQIAPGASP